MKIALVTLCAIALLLVLEPIAMPAMIPEWQPSDRLADLRIAVVAFLMAAAAFRGNA